MLLREYLELWDGRYEYSFKRRIDAIEVFPDYITALHNFIYNNVYHGNVFDYVDMIDYRYDLVLLIDVLEHFDFPMGKKLLKKLLQKHKAVIVSTPKDPKTQYDLFGNVYETHRSRWTREELAELATAAFQDDDSQIIVLLSYCLP